MSDIDEMLFAIESVRVNNLYGVVDWLKREHRIEVKENIKLDALLKNLSGRYPIAKCVYVMSYNAKSVAAFIHSKEPSSLTLPHLFTRFTERYLERGDEDNLEVKFFRSVPDNVEPTVLEVLICDHLFDTEYN